MTPFPPLVLLPGLDGTGLMYRPLVQALGDHPAQVVAYPPDERLGYDDLEPWLRERLPDGPFLLVAESFSGPLALRIAAEPPHGLEGLVLVASFARPPRWFPPWLAELVLRVAFALPPPGWLLRALLLGPGAPQSLVDLLRTALRSVRPAVMAHRVAEVMRVDVTEQLERIRVPVAYLRAASDRVVPPASAAWMLERRPLLHLAVLEGPHLLAQRAPSALIAQLEALSRPSPTSER